MGKNAELPQFIYLWILKKSWVTVQVPHFFSVNNALIVINLTSTERYSYQLIYVGVIS